MQVAYLELLWRQTEIVLRLRYYEFGSCSREFSDLWIGDPIWSRDENFVAGPTEGNNSLED